MTYDLELNKGLLLEFHLQLMIIYVLLLGWNLTCGTLLAPEKIEACMISDVPMPVTSVPDRPPHDEDKQTQNDEALGLLSDYRTRKKNVNLQVEIGQHTYTIIEVIGTGAEGIAYKAKDSNGNNVLIKALLEEAADFSAFQLEIMALEKLGRLIDKDDVHFIMVQTFLQGESFSELLENDVREKAGNDDYPSNHKADHLKEKYFQILWKFRNDTQMTHNDFRPYNIIGDEAIDFSRSEILSTDSEKRQMQLNWDDSNAEKEWEWFYIDQDFRAIEENPLLPDSLKAAYDLWDRYMIRYDGYKEYRVEWMKVLHYIVETKDIGSRSFPHESEFYNQ